MLGDVLALVPDPSGLLHPLVPPVIRTLNTPFFAIFFSWEAFREEIGERGRGIRLGQKLNQGSLNRWDPPMRFIGRRGIFDAVMITR